MSHDPDREDLDVLLSRLAVTSADLALLTALQDQAEADLAVLLGAGD